jgi:hypothetical protein
VSLASFDEVKKKTEGFGIAVPRDEGLECRPKTGCPGCNLDTERAHMKRIRNKTEKKEIRKSMQVVIFCDCSEFIAVRLAVAGSHCDSQGYQNCIEL